MPRARVNSTTVSLTEAELEKLDALYRVAWGSGIPDKTQRKLAKALKRIKNQQEAAERRREARDV
jgi:hypothetical protein